MWCVSGLHWRSVPQKTNRLGTQDASAALQRGSMAAPLASPLQLPPGYDVHTGYLRSAHHVRAYCNYCVVTSRDSESHLFLLPHARGSLQKCNWTQPADSRLDITAAFDYICDVCMCRIWHRHGESTHNRWGAVSLLCTPSSFRRVKENHVIIFIEVKLHVHR